MNVSSSLFPLGRSLKLARKGFWLWAVFSCDYQFLGEATAEDKSPQYMFFPEHLARNVYKHSKNKLRSIERAVLSLSIMISPSGWASSQV